MTIQLTRQNLMNIRQYCLGIVAELERINKEPLTTSEMRQWFRHFGPEPERAREQVEELRK